METVVMLCALHRQRLKTLRMVYKTECENPAGLRWTKN